MSESIDPEIMGELLGLLAHDLRNPLSALHSNLGFIGASLEQDPDEVREAVKDTLTSCDGLASIIDNIEVLGRGLVGRPVAKTPVAIALAVSELLARSLAMADSHGVLLEQRDSVSSDLRVVANPEMLSLALRNLIRNSIQHTPQGQTVHVSIARQGASCTVLVEDPGAPVAQELREAAFSAAGQLHSKSLSSGRYGRGLGLFAARVAANIAGVEVAAVEPPRGTGNAFVLRAPINTG